MDQCNKCGQPVGDDVIRVTAPEDDPSFFEYAYHPNCLSDDPWGRYLARVATGKKAKDSQKAAPKPGDPFGMIFNLFTGSGSGLDALGDDLAGALRKLADLLEGK